MRPSLSFILVPSLIGISSLLAPKARGSILEVDTLHTDLTSPSRHFGEAQIVATRPVVHSTSVNTKFNTTDIQQSIGQSITSVLERAGGVSSLQTGANVSKPTIQGMYGTRILIVNNCARQTGQQWGLDHSPEVDQHGAHHLTVVKGAESVRYGSEAMGGVVFLQPQPLPYFSRTLRGRLVSLYGSNGRRLGLVGELEGALGSNRNWAWRAQTTLQNSGDRSSAHYLLNNTGSRDQHFSMAVGYRNVFSHAEVFLSRFDQKYAVLQSAQMGNEQLLKERIAIGRPIDILPFSREIDYPYQRVVHDNATLRLRHATPRLGTWLWQSTYQYDHRGEHRSRRLNRSNIPAVSLYLQSWQHQLRWEKQLSSSWKMETGGQTLWLNHHNEAGTGVVPIIPNYTEQSLGLYTVQKYQHGVWSAEGGVRFDHQQTRADGFDWTGQRYGGKRTFANLTYFFSGRRQITDRISLTSNLGMAWRAPHVHELYSNGNELGSGIFVRGDEHLQSERGYKWISSLRYESSKMQVQIEGYLHWLNGFIYDRPLQKSIVVVSGTYPLFQFIQTNAFFRGVDFDLRYVPFRNWEHHVSLSALWANERPTGNYLPFIPAPRLQQELIYRPKSYWFALLHRFTARQNRFDPSIDLVAKSPAAYHLLGAEAGTTFFFSNEQQLRLFLSAENLLNHEYKEYTNRARYYAHDLGRDIRLSLSWHF